MDEINMKEIIEDCEIAAFKKHFFKMVRYGITYTDEEIEGLESSLMKDYGRNEKVGLKDIYEQARRIN